MSFDISPDGRTVAAGTDQNNEDASIAFWYFTQSLFQVLSICSSKRLGISAMDRGPVLFIPLLILRT